MTSSFSTGYLEDHPRIVRWLRTSPLVFLERGQRNNFAGMGCQDEGRMVFFLEQQAIFGRHGCYGGVKDLKCLMNDLGISDICA